MSAVHLLRYYSCQCLPPYICTGPKQSFTLFHQCIPSTISVYNPFYRYGWRCPQQFKIHFCIPTCILHINLNQVLDSFITSDDNCFVHVVLKMYIIQLPMETNSGSAVGLIKAEEKERERLGELLLELPLCTCSSPMNFDLQLLTKCA